MSKKLMMLTQLKSYWFVVNENFEDTIGVIRSRKSKMDRQYNSKEKTDKKTNNDLHNTTQKTRDWVKRIPINLEVLFRCSGRVCSSCSTSGTRRVTLVTNSIINHVWSRNWNVIMANRTYMWLFVTQIFRSG